MKAAQRGLPPVNTPSAALRTDALSASATKRAAGVVMFCPQFRPIVGGAERQAEKLALALAESGLAVKILTPRLDDESPRSEIASAMTIERFPLIDLSRRYPFPGVAVLNIPYMLWQVVRAVKPHLQGAQVLHCHLASLQTTGAALAGRFAGVHVLCKAAMADQRSDLGEIEKTGATGPLVAWLARMLIQTWVATTAAVEDALIRAGVERRRIVRIPNGTESQHAAVEREPLCKVRRFLYLGRLSSNIDRDIPTLIAAFDALAAVYPDIELALVGGGDLLEEVRRIAQGCAARSRIYLPGFDAPAPWLGWADCFVLPSKREGLSNALLEAMAAGLPCIANDIGPNREVLNDGKAGILVPMGDRHALEQAMRRMIDDSALAMHYARMAGARVKQCYSIESVASLYGQLYRSLSMDGA
jgi:L-malate glycosyltransferase